MWIKKAGAKVLSTRKNPKLGIDILKKAWKVKINEINSAEPHEFLPAREHSSYRK
jgi:hypothetical protein